MDTALALTTDMQIVLGLVLLAIWGGIFWGMLPGRVGVSWQAHLAGAVGGLLAALLVARADAPARRAAAGPAAGPAAELGAGGR